MHCYSVVILWLLFLFNCLRLFRVFSLHVGQPLYMLSFEVPLVFFLFLPDVKFTPVDYWILRLIPFTGEYRSRMGLLREKTLLWQSCLQWERSRSVLLRTLAQSNYSMICRWWLQFEREGFCKSYYSLPFTNLKSRLVKMLRMGLISKLETEFILWRGICVLQFLLWILWFVSLSVNSSDDYEVKFFKIKINNVVERKCWIVVFDRRKWALGSSSL